MRKTRKLSGGMPKPGAGQGKGWGGKNKTAVKNSRSAANIAANNAETQLKKGDPSDKEIEAARAAARAAIEAGKGAGAAAAAAATAAKDVRDAKRAKNLKRLLAEEKQRAKAMGNTTEGRRELYARAQESNTPR